MNIEDLKFLLGSWEGKGTAQYLSAERIDYDEFTVFEFDDFKNVISYIQNTRFSGGENKGRTLHAESGYIKQPDSGCTTLSNSQNNGRVEVLLLKDILKNNGITTAVFISKQFGNDERMIETQREYSVNNEILTYEMKMATNKDSGLKTHLKAELKRKI
jgi:hypothetical protein